MLALVVSLCLAAVPDPRFAAIIPIPARPAPPRSATYETFVPLGITADRTRLIAQAGKDLVHWDVAANQVAARWAKILPDQSTDRVAVSEDGRWLGIADGRTWKLWDITARRAVATFVLPQEALRFLAVAPDGKTALTTSRRDVRIWDVATGRERASRTAASDLCWVASNAAFDEHIVFQWNPSELVWLTDTGAVRRRAGLKDPPVVDGPHGDPFRTVQPVRATPDGRELVYPGAENWITLDRATGAVTATAGPSQEKADGNAKAPSLWVLDPAGKKIVSFAWGGNAHLRVLDRGTGAVLARHQFEPYDSRTFLAASADGGEVYLSRPEDNGYDVIDAATGRPGRDLGPVGKLLEAGTEPEPDRSFKDGLFTSETQFLVLNQSWQLRLHDLQNPLRVVREADVPGDGISYRWSLSPTGNTLAVVRYGNPYVAGDKDVVPQLHLWNVREGNWLSAALLPAPGEPLFTPDAEYVVVPCEGLERSTVYVVIDVFNGRRKHVLRSPGGSSGALLPGPTGQLGWERGYSREPDFRWELDPEKGEFRPAPVVWVKRWEANGRVSPDRRSELSPTDTKHQDLASPSLKRHRQVSTMYMWTGTGGDAHFSPDSRFFAIRTTPFLGDAFTGRCDRQALPGDFVAFSPTGDRIAVRTEAGVGIVEKARVAPARAGAALTIAQARAHWRNLANLAQPGKARRQVFETAMLALVTSPGTAIEAAKSELKPAAPLSASSLGKLFAQLDGPSADVRLNAFDRLGAMDRRVLAKVVEFEASGASHEAKRLARKVAATIPDDAPTQPQDIRAINAVEVLERIGTPDALKLLGDLAEGDPAATLTREAAAAHHRLNRLQELRERR